MLWILTTNYFHYLGSGHVVRMIKVHGNLWRFCNEGVESIDALASKRYNGFNNKGGYKATCKNEMKRKCLPFEVLGSWLLVCGTSEPPIPCSPLNP